MKNIVISHVTVHICSSHKGDTLIVQLSHVTCTYIFISLKCDICTIKTYIII